MCEGRVQDVRDGIISRSIWAIGKLKRVQSNRDGGANVVLNKSLKNLNDYWCEGNWTIVIQARGWHRDDDRFFKGGGDHRGSKGLIKDLIKQTSKLISARPQNTASIRSGCFPDVHSLWFPPNLVLRHGDYMIIAALPAAFWCTDRQSRCRHCIQSGLEDV